MAALGSFGKMPPEVNVAAPAMSVVAEALIAAGEGKES